MLRKPRIKILCILADERLRIKLGCSGGKRKDPASWRDTDDQGVLIKHVSLIFNIGA